MTVIITPKKGLVQADCLFNYAYLNKIMLSSYFLCFITNKIKFFKTKHITWGSLQMMGYFSKTNLIGCIVVTISCLHSGNVLFISVFINWLFCRDFTNLFCCWRTFMWISIVLSSSPKCRRGRKFFKPQLCTVWCNWSTPSTLSSFFLFPYLHRFASISGTATLRLRVFLKYVLNRDFHNMKASSCNSRSLERWGHFLKIANPMSLYCSTFR